MVSSSRKVEKKEMSDEGEIYKNLLKFFFSFPLSISSKRQAKHLSHIFS